MRSFLKKLFLFLLIALAAVQVPFVYRRWQLGQAAERIAATNAQNTSRSGLELDEYVGVIHAHTGLGGHSTGTFDALIGGANAAGLDFVLMTEHWSDEYDTSALTLNGRYGRTLFVGGNEIDTADADRFLMIPGSAEAAGLRRLPTDAVLAKLHAEGRLALITYPEKYRTWTAPFDGIEVLSLHTEAKAMNRFTALLDLIWSGPSYPELTLARHFERPDANFAKFDETAAARRIVLFAGTDAHSNIGFHIFGDDAGHKAINIKLDPYWLSFRIARLHILLPKGTPFSRDTLLSAVRDGSFYTGIDAIGDTRGFRFEASGGENLSIRLPVEARVVVYRDGQRFAEAAGSELSIPTAGPGAYRAEVYRTDLGTPFETVPWIMSNPVYVR